jgi:hypothetical protein
MDCNLTSQWMLSLLGILSCNSYSKVCITISIIISLATNVTSHCDVEIAISTAPIPPVVNDTVPINSIVL